MQESETHSHIIAEVRSELADERNWVANLANVAAIVYHAFNRIDPQKVNWAGFYMLRDDMLVLGPFQGTIYVEIFCPLRTVRKSSCDTHQSE